MGKSPFFNDSEDSQVVDDLPDRDSKFTESEDPDIYQYDTHRQLNFESNRQEEYQERRRNAVTAKSTI